MRHQCLLDLEEAISDAGSVVSYPQKSGGGASRPPARPSSARPQSARPASATSEGCRARRPSSARGARPPSSASTASGHSMASAHSMASSGSARSTTSLRGPCERGAQHSAKDFSQICELIGTKAAQRFRSMQECFRFVDTDHNHSVTRAEIRDFCNTLNIAREHADLFYDMLDVRRRGEIDFLDVATIVGPYIHPGYQAPNFSARPASAREQPRQAAGVRTAAPRAMYDYQQRDRVPDQDFDKLIELIGSKASQKYRTVTECFRFMDESKNGRISRDKCRRFVEELGFNPNTGDSLFRYLAGNHQDVDFLKFSETFGPYIQPGYTSGSMRAPTPPPHRVTQAPATRQRPQSARPSGRGGRSRAASHVHAAAEWQQKVARSGSSAASLCSASTASGPRSSCSSIDVEPERPVPGYVAEPDKPPCRAEVTERHLGSYMYLPETPRAVNNGTWDSSQVKNRMVLYPDYIPGNPARSAGHHPQPPSAPPTSSTRHRRHRPRDVEVYQDNMSEHGSYYCETTSACDSPHESRYIPAQCVYHKDYSGSLIRAEPLSSGSTGNLHRTLENRWSVL